jgi:hypothetical protein
MKALWLVGLAAPLVLVSPSFGQGTPLGDLTVPSTPAQETKRSRDQTNCLDAWIKDASVICPSGLPLATLNKPASPALSPHSCRTLSDEPCTPLR